jgi:large subunit ribosomal protein L18
MYAQLIDDVTGKSLVQISTLAPELKAKSAELTKSEMSVELGKLMANKAKEAGIANIVFDRGGYIYHGRVKAVADAVREAGLNF